MPKYRRPLGLVGSMILWIGLGCGPSTGDDPATGDTGSTSPSDTASGSETTLATTTPAADSTTDPGGPTTAEGSGDPATTTGAIPEPCFPAELRGALRPELSIPGFTVYEGCEDNKLLIEYTGEPLAIDFDEVSAIRDQTTLFPGQVTGLWGVGTGLCCLDAQAICINLDAEPDTVLPDLVAYVDSAISERVTECFGLTVRLGDPPVLE